MCEDTYGDAYKYYVTAFGSYDNTILPDNNILSYIKIEPDIEEKPNQCQICQKTFLYPSLLLAHVRKHTGEKPYVCVVCNKGFTQNEHLRLHMRRHTGEKPFKCKFCQKTFYRSCHRAIHERIHTGEKPYTCNICQKKFIQQSHLNAHKVTHSFKKEYKCDICKKSFGRMYHLTLHQRLHTNEKPFSCNVCPKSFKQSSHLKKHQASKHGLMLPYFCHICEKGFARYAEYNFHMGIHDPADKPGEINKDIKPDISEDIPIEKLLEKESNFPYQCNICQKRFKYLCYLTQHKLIHTGQMVYRCTICQKTYSTLSQLTRHKIIHTNMKSSMDDIKSSMEDNKKPILSSLIAPNTLGFIPQEYECDVCHKTFEHRLALAGHKTTHYGRNINKVYCCDICHAEFTKRLPFASHYRKFHNLILPKKIYRQQKRYTSEISQLAKQKTMQTNKILKLAKRKKKCIEGVPKLPKPKRARTLKIPSFAQLYNDEMLNHNGSYDDYKVSYKCNICRKSFGCHFDLFQHVQIHIPKPPSYSIYERLYNELAYFETPEKKLDQKTFHCTVCQKKFTQSALLYAHMWMHTK